MPIKKAVVWGHKLHSHTHSYVHEGFWRAFQSLGVETYWLDDRDDVSGLDLSGALFITEGQVDGRIPIRHDCHYVLHNCNPDRYATIASRCLRLQVYTDALPRASVERVGPGAYYGGGTLFQPWATDLLPAEIHPGERVSWRRRRIWWIGTIGGGEFGNTAELAPFRRACHDHGVAFTQRQHVSRARHGRLVRRSWLAPAIHGGWQVAQGYIACRLFKNISYGHAGLTNSASAQALFDGQLLCTADTYDLFLQGEALVGDRGRFARHSHDLMALVRERHTYINRIKTICAVLPSC